MQPEKREHIDKLVGDAMRHIKPAYRESLWQGIESELPPMRKKPLFEPLARIGALAVLLTGLVGSYFIFTADEKENVTVQQSHISTPEKIASNTTKHQPEQNTENPYKAQQKNASGLNDNNTFSAANNISANNSSAGKKYNKNLTGKKAVENNYKYTAIAQENNLNPEIEAFDNLPIYASIEKSLLPLVDNQQLAENNANRNWKGFDVDDEYRKPKNRRKGTFANWQNITYNFWQNPAYTGEQARYNFSFDDKFSYFDELNTSDYHNTFAFDMRIPKTRFSAGVYHQRWLKSYSLRTATGLSASAQLFSIGNGYLRAGASVFRYESSLFKNNLVFNDQIDPGFFGIGQTTRQRDFTSTKATIGYDAGLWYASPGLMAGFSVKNINRPLFGYLESGERLQRVYNFSAGYNIPVTQHFTVTPWAELSHSEFKDVADALLLVSYKNKVMLGGGIKNVNTENKRGGDATAYAAVEIKNSLRVFASYAQNIEMKRLGFTQNIIHTGIRYQIQ